MLYIGASNIEAWRLARALWISDTHRLARFDWVQNSAACSTAPRARMFPLCADLRVGYGVQLLAGGWLTGKYEAGRQYPDGSRMTLRPEPYRHLESGAVFRALAALADEARARQVEMSALALAWVLNHPRMSAAIVGPRRPSHLDAALAALAIELSPEDLARLGALFELSTLA